MAFKLANLELEIAENSTWKIYMLCVNGKNEVEEYLNKLKKKRPNEHGALMGAFEKFLKHGPSSSNEKFKCEGDGIFVLKAHQQRVYGFYGGENPNDRNCFITCVCDEKKQDKADPKVLDKARDLKKEYEKERKTKNEKKR